MVDFEKLKINDFVKCYTLDGCPTGYVFNGVVLAKNVKVDNMVNDYGEITSGIVDCIVIDYRDSKRFFEKMNVDLEKFGNDFDYRMRILREFMSGCERSFLFEKK